MHFLVHTLFLICNVVLIQRTELHTADGSVLIIIKNHSVLAKMILATKPEYEPLEVAENNLASEPSGAVCYEEIILSPSCKVTRLVDMEEVAPSESKPAQ